MVSQAHECYTQLATLGYEIDLPAMLAKVGDLRLGEGPAAQVTESSRLQRDFTKAKARLAAINKSRWVARDKLAEALAAVKTARAEEMRLASEYAAAVGLETGSILGT